MRILKQGTTPTVVFLLVLASDGKTGATGLAVTVKLAKYGGSGSMTSGATATNSATQIDAVNLPGWYQITLTAVETNTIGDLIIRATATGADQGDRLFVVESADISDLDVEIDTVLAMQGSYQTAIISAITSAEVAVLNGTPSPATINDALTALHGSGLWNNTAPTAAQIDAALTAAHGSGSWLSGSGGSSGGTSTGPGSIITHIIVTDNASAPLDGVACWITSDSAGAHVIAGTLYTDAHGVADFMLDTGSFWLWRQRGGINFDNPTSITVTA